MYLQIDVGDDLEYYYYIEGVTLLVNGVVQTVKAEVYSIGPEETLVYTKVIYTTNGWVARGSGSSVTSCARCYHVPDRVYDSQYVVRDATESPGKSAISPWVSRNSCPCWVPGSCSHTYKCSLLIGQYLPGCRTGHT